MNPNTSRRMVRLTVPGLVVAGVLVPTAASAQASENVDVVVDQTSETSADAVADQPATAPVDQSVAVPPADADESGVTDTVVSDDVDGVNVAEAARTDAVVEPAAATEVAVESSPPARRPGRRSDRDVRRGPDHPVAREQTP